MKLPRISPNRATGMPGSIASTAAARIEPQAYRYYCIYVSRNDGRAIVRATTNRVAEGMGYDWKACNGTMNSFAVRSATQPIDSVRQACRNAAGSENCACEVSSSTVSGCCTGGVPADWSR